jgi:hypothetical protein
MRVITLSIILLFSMRLFAQNTTEKLTALPFGSVKPTGWLKDQMQKDINGFVGNLDQIVPALINDPIYSTGRLQKHSEAKDLGNLKEGILPVTMSNTNGGIAKLNLIGGMVIYVMFFY